MKLVYIFLAICIILIGGFMAVCGGVYLYIGTSIEGGPGLFIIGIIIGGGLLIKGVSELSKIFHK